MNAARTPGSRARRTALAAAGLGLASLVVAPAAMADSYNSVAPEPTTAVLGSAQVTTSHAHAHAAKHSTRHHSSSGDLAYTGFEAGGVAVAGLGLVAGGVLLVRGGRRRAGTPA